jgi:hypothetical protein
VILVQNRYIAAGLCLLGVALAGCAGSQNALSGAGPSAQPSAPGALPSTAVLPGQSDAGLAKVQACQLVPAAVVHQVLGQLEAPPQENGGTICLYTKALDGSQELISLVVSGLGTYNIVKAADTQIAKNGSLKMQETPGIGDDAFATLVPAGPSYTLNASKGNLAISIHVDSSSVQDQQQVRQLMISAIGHL